MSTKSITAELKRLPKTPEEWRVSELLKQYGCGPIAFAGSENAFYERHLVFAGVANCSQRRVHVLVRATRSDPNSVRLG